MNRNRPAGDCRYHSQKMGEDMRSKVILAIGAISLSGCALAWQDTNKVEFASASSITIQYDPSLTNFGAIQNVAQKHCAGFNKDAVPQGNKMEFGGTETAMFLCKARA